MADHYSFGIEIEITAVPKSAQPELRTQHYYYKKFAEALEARGLKARADELNLGYRKHPEEYNRGWWITKDGSIASSGDSSVELEAVSPILTTNQDWAGTIDKFWMAQSAVFRMPAKGSSCGSHIHISPAQTGKWSDQQLRDIAVGIAYFEKYVQEMLPASRRDNEYCQRNTASSSRLAQYCSGQTSWNGLLATVRVLDRYGLISFMQRDRKVLWNFQPTAAHDIGTIEFRGGRNLRGPNRTKWWIAFAVGYIDLLLEQKISTTGQFPNINSTAELYAAVRSNAGRLGLKYLPADHNVLNESKSEASRLLRGRLTDAWRSIPSAVRPKTPPPAYTSQERYHAPSPPPLLSPPSPSSITSPPPATSPPHNQSNTTSNQQQQQGETPEKGFVEGISPRLCSCLLSALMIFFAALVLIMNAVYISNSGGCSQTNWAELVTVLSPFVALFKLCGSSRCEAIADGVMLLFWIIAFGTNHDAFIPGGSSLIEAIVWLEFLNMMFWLLSFIFSSMPKWLGGAECSRPINSDGVRRGPAMSQV